MTCRPVAESGPTLETTIVNSTRSPTLGRALSAVIVSPTSAERGAIVVVVGVSGVGSNWSTVPRDVVVVIVPGPVTRYL